MNGSRDERVSFSQLAKSQVEGLLVSKPDTGRKNRNSHSSTGKERAPANSAACPPRSVRSQIQAPWGLSTQSCARWPCLFCSSAADNPARKPPRCRGIEVCQTKSRDRPAAHCPRRATTLREKGNEESRKALIPILGACARETSSASAGRPRIARPTASAGLSSACPFPCFPNTITEWAGCIPDAGAGSRTPKRRENTAGRRRIAQFRVPHSGRDTQEWSPRSDHRPCPRPTDGAEICQRYSRAWRPGPLSPAFLWPLDRYWIRPPPKYPSIRWITSCGLIISMQCGSPSTTSTHKFCGRSLLSPSRKGTVRSLQQPPSAQQGSALKVCMN